MTTETKHTLPIKSREELHRTYGGCLYKRDFELSPGGYEAARIEGDFSFDYQCMLDMQSRERRLNPFDGNSRLT